MWKTIVRRLLILIPQLILISLLLFLLASRMPGDALTGLIGPEVTGEALEALRVKLGFYDPWYVKYWNWITSIVSKGDFGISYIFKTPVLTVIGEKAGNTIILSLVTTLITYAIALPLGMISGRYNGSLADRSITIYSFISMAMPTAIMSIFMVYFFGYRLHWFPTGNSVSAGVPAGTFKYYMDRLYHMILPAFSYALVTTSGTIQYLRSEIIDFKNNDFVTTARSKGVPQKKVYSRHILRNASLPIVSFVGYEVSALVTGAVFIETIFSYPGIGKLFIDSLGKRDFPVVNALVLLTAVMVVVGNLVSDILISVVDPRIRIK